jgi:hypothetical protein
MLNSIKSEHFQCDKLGSNMISVKVNGMGNMISFPVKHLEELINILHKSETEFFPHTAARSYLDKLFER